MKKSPLLMLGLCALLSACQTTKPQSVCDGWMKLRAKPDTAVFLIQKDRSLANGIASHNIFGKTKGCWD